MKKIKVGDKVKVKDFKTLKKENPERFLWRMFEISDRIATILEINEDGSYIIDLDKKFPVTRNMFKLIKNGKTYSNYPYSF